MQLLTDVFIIENLQVLEEGTKNGVMKVRGVFGRAEEENNNGRIYPNKVLGGQVGTLQDLISERRLCGELDHPQNETVKLSNASHLITKLEMKGNELMGEAEILKTPAGLTAQALINGGVKIGISSRGMGTLSEDYSGKKVVNEDYKLVTFDLVADPSTRGAYPGLSESTQSKFARETQATLTKEGNFVTMLESKLRDAYQPWVDEATGGRAKAGRGGRSLPAKTVGRYKGPALAKEEKPKEEKPKEEKPKQQKESFELVKADGHWHRIAEMLQGSLTEDWGDEQEAAAASTAGGGAGTATRKDISLERARRKTAKAQERVARAQGEAHSEAGRSRGGPGVLKAFRQRAGAAVEAKGERKRTRAAIIDKEKAIATGKGEADREAYRQKKKTTFAKGWEDRGGTAGALGRAVANRPKFLGGGKKKVAPEVTSKSDSTEQPPKVEPKVKPGISAEEKYQRKVLGRKELEKGAEAVQSQARGQSQGAFGSGVGREDKGAMQKSIARQNKRRAKKGLPPLKMTDQQALDLGHTSYKHLGMVLAEGMGLIENMKKSGSVTGSKVPSVIRKGDRARAGAENKEFSRVVSRQLGLPSGTRVRPSGVKQTDTQGLSGKIAASKKGKTASPKFGAGIDDSRIYKHIGKVISEKKNWIQDAEKSIERRGTEGKCTPITKPGCTGRAKALAKTFKKMAKDK
jgi:hypothetical protein